MDKSEVRTHFLNVSSTFQYLLKPLFTNAFVSFQSLCIGDVLIGQVQQKTFHGLLIRVVATEIGTRLRDLRDLGVKVNS